MKRFLLLVLVFILPFSGCSRYKEFDRINRAQSMTIMNLNDEINTLNAELDALMASRNKLDKAKALLEKKLQEELNKGELTVNMEDKGLVVTVLSNVLFDSGKAELKESSIKTLTKVGKILLNDVPDQMILIEGHTDSDPIKHSPYRSNWELSTARAIEVLHFFVDKIGVDPERVVVCGYGEYHPVASNETEEGKAKNRRVEIVISPNKIVRTTFSGEQDEVSEF